MGLEACSMDVASGTCTHNAVTTGPINFCLTIPPPAGPSPLPHMNKGSTSSVDPACEKIKHEGEPIHTYYSKIPSLNGNEAGVIATKDVTVSGTNLGAIQALPVPAVVVHFGGGSVTVNTNPGTSDCKK